MVILILILLITFSQNINQQCSKQIASKNYQLDYLINQNDICPVHSHCLDNNYCACDTGYIGNCTQNAYQMVDGSDVTTTASNLDYTFFSISQEPDNYVILIFTLCHSSSSSNLELIDVWEDKGTLQILNKTNSLPGGRQWAISQGCYKLSTPLMVFGSQINGLPEKFILGIKLTQQGSINLSIKLQVDVFDFWDLFQKFLLILGGIFLFIILVVIAIFVFKWRRNRRFRGRRQVEFNDISHFDNFMPRYKSNVQNRYRTEEQNCSVCLLELADGDWLRKTVCNHIFHQQCLDQWCKSNLTCPMCRKSLQLKQIHNQISFENIQGTDMRNPLI